MLILHVDPLLDIRNKMDKAIQSPDWYVSVADVGVWCVDLGDRTSLSARFALLLSLAMLPFLAG